MFSWWFRACPKTHFRLTPPKCHSSFAWCHWGAQWHCVLSRASPFHVYFIWAAPSEKMSSSMRKTAQIQIHPTHTQSLIRAFALLCYILQSPIILLANIEGPDQIARMHRLIWTFAARICLKTRVCMVRSICFICNISNWYRYCSSSENRIECFIIQLWPLSGIQLTRPLIKVARPDLE